ncbi:MAG: hypothetical protein K9I26_01030 [Flavobacterium sp.]|nr:hypothetical protein [Flavobacterium sp.]
MLTATRIWVIGLKGSWFLIWDDLANPGIGLNLALKNALIPTLWAIHSEIIKIIII